MAQDRGDHEVTTIAPMKRGLKVNAVLCCTDSTDRYNHCPDEKGTESSALERLALRLRLRYNHCPDEKGTERIQPSGESYRTLSYNHCPDEKGTESSYL